MFSCPFCQQQVQPLVVQKVSTAGWVVFVVLLLFCIPLCWLPFVLSSFKDQASRCPSCGRTWQ